MIGLLPFVLWRLVQFRSDWGRSWFGWVMLVLVGAASLAGALFLAGGAQDFRLLPGSRIEALKRLLVTPPFVLVELLPFALILRRRMLAAGPLAIATITLLVLPWFASDPLDFVLRVSHAPLFILFWVAARELSGLLQMSRIRRFAAATGLAMAAATTLGEVAFLVTHGEAHRALSPEDPLNRKSTTIFALSERIDVHEFFEICGWHYLPQYFEPVAESPGPEDR
jgi:hypothetical protein